MTRSTPLISLPRHIMIANLNGIEACRRLLARRPAEPLKLVAPGYDVYDATYVLRTGGAQDAGWIQLEPGSLGVLVSLMRQPGGASVAADSWSVPYPVADGAEKDLVPEARVDTGAILSADYAQLLAQQVDAALGAPTAHRDQAEAHAHV